MKNIFLALTICISFYSCKKEVSSTLLTYNYAENADILNCEGVDVKLYNEAYYAFENAVLLQAQNVNNNPKRIITVDFALRAFIGGSQRDLPIQDFITEEASEIFKTLMKQKVWKENHLNYNSDLVKCVAKNIDSEDIKKTFIALQEVNSLDSKLMAGAIFGNTSAPRKYQDKALMTYVALDMFYAKMFTLDFNEIKYLVKQDFVAPPVNSIPKLAAPKPEIGKPMKLKIKKPVVHGPNDGHNH